MSLIAIVNEVVMYLFAYLTYVKLSIMLTTVYCLKKLLRLNVPKTLLTSWLRGTNDECEMEISEY